ncbi:MAG: beta-ketoacyl-[acyl-carrier-protein] synthase family protein, partial [Lentisphaeria bacterium]|nr:beta-ketoacyl-[acyl-carrier-protein] synthase family protein [Lentisphaeria bacterium]
MARAAISGIGLFSALGSNAAETAENLFSQTHRLPDVPRRIKTALSKPVFELPTPSDRRVPLTFLLSALEEALADSGLTKDDLKHRKVGIAIGTTVACQLDNIPFYEQLRNGSVPENGQPLLDYIEGIPAEYLRNLLGTTGPAITISNACASGADAALLGLNWLKTGVCDLVIAGGCDSVSKVAYNGFNALRVCSDHPCMPFDADRSGLNLGDGAGVVILEDPADAKKRGIKPGFELAGAGKTADAFHITQPEGSGVELENAIRTALNEAGITGIDFANAHGTGTLVNDRVESAVLKRIFGNDLHFHSTKAMTGHTLGAAGTIELALTTLMLKLQRTAPSLRCSTPSDEIAMLPDAEPVAIPGNAALSTSLAFGGSNTALIVRKIEETEQPENKDILNAQITISAFASLQAGEPTPQKMLEICRKYGLRRLDRITQLSLAAADAVADAVSNCKDTALITVTSYGPAVTTCKVLDDILDFPEEEILPT